MTDTTQPAVTRTLDARGSFCPGPLMELIRAIREGQVGDVIAVWSADSGSKIDIPKWVEKAGHRLVGVFRARTATTRSSSRSSADGRAIGSEDSMQRVVILGGGVGGTLTANLLARKLHRQIDRGEAKVTVIDRTGAHVYQPGFMYIAMGGERAESLERSERSLLDTKVELITADATRVDTAAGEVELADGTKVAYDHLVLATGSRIVPEEIEHFDDEAHHFYSAEVSPEAAARAGRLRRRPHRHRHRRDALQVPTGSARSCLPDRDGVAEAASAREDGDAFLLADRAGLHHRVRLRDGHAHPGEAGHRTAHFLQRRNDRSAEEGGPEPRGRGAGVRLADPRAAPPWRKAGRRQRPCARCRLAAHGSGNAQGKEIRPPNTPDAEIPRRANVYAIGDATDLPLSKAGSTAHFESPIVAERIAAACRDANPT